MALPRKGTVLGVDPGLATTGYGILAVDTDTLTVLDFGILKTPAHHPLAERLVSLQQQLTTLLKRHRPDLVAIEKIFFNTNATTAIAVSQARGVLMSACGQANIPVRECTPLEVKRTVSGFGRADKRQMQRMVMLLLKLKDVPQPDDAADALAIAIWGSRMTRL